MTNSYTAEAHCKKCTTPCGCCDVDHMQSEHEPGHDCSPPPTDALQKARELAEAYPKKDATDLGKAMFNAQVALYLPSIISELERVTAERDELKRLADAAMYLKELSVKLEHQRDAALKGYRAMRNWIIMEPCGCENECDRCRLSKNLLNSFPEIK